jgi:hypothetical protein
VRRARLCAELDDLCARLDGHTCGDFADILDQVPIV